MLRRDELADLLTRRVRGLRQGHSLAEAVEDLLDEVEVYHGKWEQDLHRAPNHAERRWWVHRAQPAQDRHELREVVFSPMKR